MTPVPKYGTAECVNCYIKLPKPDMVRGKVKIGGGKRQYFNKDGKRTGSSTSTVSKQVWRCRRCAWKHRIKWAGIYAGTAAAFLFFVAASQNSKPKNQIAATSAPVSQPTFQEQIASHQPGQTVPLNVHPLNSLDPRRLAPRPTPEARPQLDIVELHAEPAVPLVAEYTAPVATPHEASDRPPANACDRLAANPNDLDKHPQVAGTPYDILRENPQAAITACQTALQEHPTELRFRYQLARALQTQTPQDAAQHLAALLEESYPAAFDNYGWLTIRLGGDARSSERYFRHGAELGNPDAMHSLASLIIKKRIRARYRGEALDLMHEAANNNHPDAIAFVDEYETKRQSKDAAEQIMLNILGGILGGNVSR